MLKTGSQLMHYSVQKIALAILLFMPLLSAAVSTEEENYYNVLLEADKARGNYDGITWQVNIQTRNKHKHYFIRALGFDLLAETLSPAKYKGNKILMVSGNMWFYKPGLSRAVPISRRQKLLGEASYGDISSTNYAHDYAIEAVRSDELNEKPCWLFNLKSKAKKNSYDRIHYWVDKEQRTGVRADYFTVSGKRIKSAIMEYQHTIIDAEKNQPFISKITIMDGIQAGSVTVMDLSEPELKKIPDYFFNVNFLRK